MKLFFRLCFLSLMLGLRPVWAQPVGRAAADIANLKPGRGETAWGRLVADALKSAGKADCAVVNAGALRAGTLAAGGVEDGDIGALLSFGADEVVTLTLSGAQIRAALERGAGAFPTSSPAFLHVSGLQATFDPDAEPGRRVGPIKIKNRAISDAETFSVAMSVGLSEGAAGYFNIWGGAQTRRAEATVQSAVADFIRNKGEIAPDDLARFAPK